MSFALSILLHIASAMRAIKRVRERLREELRVQLAALKLFESPSYIAVNELDLPSAIEGGAPSYLVWELPRGGRYRIVDGVIMPTETLRGDIVRRVSSYNVIDFTGRALASEDIAEEIRREIARVRRTS